MPHSHARRSFSRGASRRAGRVLALLVVASALAGCDKCADYFIANPFGTKPAGTCPSGAIPAAR